MRRDKSRLRMCLVLVLLFLSAEQVWAAPPQDTAGWETQGAIGQETQAEEADRATDQMTEKLLDELEL